MPLPWPGGEMLKGDMTCCGGAPPCSPRSPSPAPGVLAKTHLFWGATWGGGSSGCRHSPFGTGEGEPHAPVRGELLPAMCSQKSCLLALPGSAPKGHISLPPNALSIPAGATPGVCRAGRREQPCRPPSRVPGEDFFSRQASHGEAPPCSPCAVPIQLPGTLNGKQQTQQGKQLRAAAGSHFLWARRWSRCEAGLRTGKAGRNMAGKQPFPPTKLWPPLPAPSSGANAPFLHTQLHSGCPASLWLPKNGAGTTRAHPGGWVWWGCHTGVATVQRCPRRSSQAFSALPGPHDQRCSSAKCLGAGPSGVSTGSSAGTRRAGGGGWQALGTPWDKLACCQAMPERDAWEQRMEAEVLQPTPSLSLPGITGCPKSMGSCPPPPLVSPRFTSCLLQTAALENHQERAQSPTQPPAQAPHLWLGGNDDVQKGPRELLTIQRAFSTDAFRRRGLQVSTWFGFGSPASLPAN